MENSLNRRGFENILSFRGEENRKYFGNFIENKNHFSALSAIKRVFFNYVTQKLIIL